MAELDLTQRIIPYCDRHLVFPLLAHLAESDLFPAEQVQAAQYELAKGTNMVDYAVNLFEQVYPGEEVPKGAFSHYCRHDCMLILAGSCCHCIHTGSGGWVNRVCGEAGKCCVDE